MIVVFIPALILEVFSTFFIVKIMIYNFIQEFFEYFDFLIWNLFLVVPSFFAIYIGAATVNKRRELSNHIEKYSNYCNDDGTLLRVKLNSILVCLNQYILQINALINKLQNRSMVLSCDIFNIDWSLGLSIFATIASYIIIICQFENNN